MTGACVPRPRDFEYTLSQDLLPLKSNDDAKRSRWMAFGRANGTSDPMSGVWLVRLNGTRAARDYGGLHWNTLNGAGGHEGERDGNMEAFAKDRAELTGGGDIAGIQPAEAESVLLHWLTELDASVPSGFLFGETPSIADFSVYPPLWFLRNNPVNAPSVEAHPTVSAWMGRVEAFGHGRAAPSDGQAALDRARSLAPRAFEGEVLGVAAEVGQTVRVTPTDYGRVPVEGVLLRADAQSFVVQRESDETGTIAVHFPRTGFALDA